MILAMLNYNFWAMLKEESKGFDYLISYLEESNKDFTYYSLHFGASESRFKRTINVKDRQGQWKYTITNEVNN